MHGNLTTKDEFEKIPIDFFSIYFIIANHLPDEDTTDASSRRAVNIILDALCFHITWHNHFYFIPKNFNQKKIHHRNDQQINCNEENF